MMAHFGENSKWFKTVQNVDLYRFFHLHNRLNSKSSTGVLCKFECGYTHNCNLIRRAWHAGGNHEAQTGLSKSLEFRPACFFALFRGFLSLVPFGSFAIIEGLASLAVFGHVFLPRLPQKEESRPIPTTPLGRLLCYQEDSIHLKRKEKPLTRSFQKVPASDWFRHFETYATE